MDCFLVNINKRWIQIFIVNENNGNLSKNKLKRILIVEIWTAISGRIIKTYKCIKHYVRHNNSYTNSSNII